MAHAEHALARFANHREGFGQDVVERFAIGNAALELARFLGQLGVGKRLHPFFEGIDPYYGSAVVAQQPFVAAAENLFEETGDHLGQEGL